MEMQISGLDREACERILGSHLLGETSITWTEATAFIERISANGFAEDEGAIWFYLPPATMLEHACAISSRPALEVLDNWISQNRDALNLRRHVGDKLRFVNADAVDCAKLRVDLGAGGSSDGGATNDNGVRQPIYDARRQVIEYLLAWAAPQYREVFESLEAAARWRLELPTFRDQEVPDVVQLGMVLDALRAGFIKLDAHPTRNSAGLRGVPDRLATAMSALEAMRHAISKSDAEFDQQLRLIEERREDNAYQLLELARLVEDFSRRVIRDGGTSTAGAIGLGALDQVPGMVTMDVGEGDLSLEHLQLAQEDLEQQHLRNIEISEALKTEKRKNQTLISQLRNAEAQLQQSGSMRGSGRLSGWLWKLMPHRIQARFEQARQRKAIRQKVDLIGKSEWFDKTWYLTTYSDVRTAGMDPAEHYYEFGWKEGRNPSEAFDTAYYLKSYPDIAQSGFNPLWHYVTHGLREGRLPRKP